MGHISNINSHLGQINLLKIIGTPKDHDRGKRLPLDDGVGALWLAKRYPSNLNSVFVTGYC